MPHECTTCGHTFPDGSKEMLSGCPECGGNKFQFLPGGADEASSATESPVIESDSGSTTDDDSRATSAESGFEFSGEDPEGTPETTAGVSSDPDDIIVADDEPSGGREDRAQASARSAVVSDDELPPSDAGETDPDGATREDASQRRDDRPDISELREELNDQFESIKILQPGEYELNLMELYDREERIVALEEDGRYVIDVPSSWHEDENEE